MKIKINRLYKINLENLDHLKINLIYKLRSFKGISGIYYIYDGKYVRIGSGECLSARLLQHESSMGVHKIVCIYVFTCKFGTEENEERKSFKKFAKSIIYKNKSFYSSEILQELESYHNQRTEEIKTRENKTKAKKNHGHLPKLCEICNNGQVHWFNGSYRKFLSMSMEKKKVNGKIITMPIVYEKYACENCKKYLQAYGRQIRKEIIECINQNFPIDVFKNKKIIKKYFENPEIIWPQIFQNSKKEPIGNLKSFIK